MPIEMSKSAELIIDRAELTDKIREALRDFSLKHPDFYVLCSVNNAVTKTTSGDHNYYEVDITVKLK